MKKMNPVVHFEMPAQEVKRMAAFYSKVFGWEPKMMGKEMANYVTMTTTQMDAKGMPMQPGSINGGFYPKTADMAAQHPSIVIAVDDIMDAIRRIKSEGCNVMGEPADIPNVGKYVSFIDTEGNRVSMMQPSMMMEGAM